MLFNQVTLVGAGLLGGSLGLALQKHALARRVVAYVRRQESVEEALRLGVAQAATLDLAEAVRDSDLVVLCTPISQMRPLTEGMLPSLRPGTLVTDVGSVKGSVVAELEPLCARVSAEFVGSHPMAGGEQAGMWASKADLFQKAVSIITPTRATRPESCKRVESLWTGVGSLPIRLSPEAHDELVSRSSHLPHVVAAELAHYVLSPAHPKDQARLCAGGFRDSTRIASGSPEMWRDISLANRKNLSRVLGVFIESLEEFQHTLDSGDAEELEAFFRSAKERRDRWVESQGNGSPE